jgi:hypothetical protein
MDPLHVAMETWNAPTSPANEGDRRMASSWPMTSLNAGRSEASRWKHASLHANANANAGWGPSRVSKVFRDCGLDINKAMR